MTRAESDTAVQVTGRTRRAGYLVIGASAVGGLLYGYDTGVISGALLYIGRDFDLGSTAKQLVTSVVLVGAMVGALVSGPLADRVGRRPLVGVIALVFCAGTALACAAPNIPLLIGGRFVIGLAVGAAGTVIPVYLAELAAPHIRGTLVVLIMATQAFGQLVAYLVNFAYSGSGNWRMMFGLGLVPAIVLLLTTAILPESPRWLFGVRREADALAVLRRIRGDEAEAAQEAGEIRDVLAAETGRTGRRSLFAPHVRPALLVAVGIAVLCQITGINAVMYYAPTILAEAGFADSAAILTTVGVGIVLTAIAVIGSRLVERWGRRKLLLAFAPGTPIPLAVLGLVFFVTDDLTTGTQWLIVICLLAYIAFNGGSLSVVVWLIGSEVFPRAVRSSAMALSTIGLWVSNLLVSMTALTLTETIGRSGMFWLYAAIGVLSWVFVYRYVPETKGRSLEQIERSLHDGTFLPRRRT